jgi:hypothetical protein
MSALPVGHDFICSGRAHKPRQKQPCFAADTEGNGKIFLTSKFERTLFTRIRLFALFWGCSDDAGVDNRCNQLFKGIPKPEQRA